MGESCGTATRSSTAGERYAWVAGIVFVLALLADVAVASGIPINQNDSAAKIATALDDHGTRLLVIAGVCVVYAAMFPIYLWKLYDLTSRGRRTVANLGARGRHAPHRAPRHKRRRDHRPARRGARVVRGAARPRMAVGPVGIAIPTWDSERLGFPPWEALAMGSGRHRGLGPSRHNRRDVRGED